ncbi:MAG: enolase C-terminal domain-like protein, partial [Pseudomonadota bacterium]
MRDSVVERLIVRHCKLPVRRPRDHGSGRVADHVEVVILQITTSDGAKGWGEASPWSVFTGTPEACFAALTRYLSPVVLGRRLADIPAIMAEAETAIVGHPEAKVALETALLDAGGQVTGLPIHMLLGGCMRARIPLSISLADPDFDADMEMLATRTAEGLNIVKVKTGVRDHGFDLDRLDRLRSTYPALDIRIDYNQGLEPFGALRKLRDIEAFDVTFIEQPFRAAHRDAMADMTAALDTPMLADESVFSPSDMIRAVSDRLCDAVSVKIMKTGGLRRGLEVAAIAGAAGLPGYGGDMFETGIAHLAGAHMIAAAPNIT